MTTFTQIDTHNFTHTSITIKEKNDDNHTGRFEHYMRGIVPLWTGTLTPTQCISDPLLLFRTCTLMVIPTKLKKILPSKRHIRSQTLTEQVSKRTLQALIMGK